MADSSHDHGSVQRTIAVAPRAEMRIGDQEVVLTYAGGALVLFLHSYVDGLPTSGAEFEITVDFMPSALAEIAPGVYRSEALTLAGGRNQIDLAYVIGDQSGDEVVTLSVPANAGKAATKRSGPVGPGTGVPGSVLATIAVLLFAAVNVLLIRRARRA